MKRQGLTILEVLVAVAIFFMAIGVIAQLLILAGDRALEVRFQSEAAQLCQSKLAELAAGAVPFESQTDIPLDEDDSWMWSLEAEQGPVTGLWKVKVSMARNRPDGSRNEYCSVSQLILDPATRGSTMDSVAIGGTDTSTSGTGSSSSGSTPSSSSGSDPSQSSGGTGSGGSPSSGGSPAGGGGGGGSSGGGGGGGGGSGTTRPGGSGSTPSTGGGAGGTSGGPTTPSTGGPTTPSTGTNPTRTP